MDCDGKTKRTLEFGPGAAGVGEEEKARMKKVYERGEEIANVARVSEEERMRQQFEELYKQHPEARSRSDERPMPMYGDKILAPWGEKDGYWLAEVVKLEWDDDEKEFRYDFDYLTNDDGTLIDPSEMAHRGVAALSRDGGATGTAWRYEGEDPAGAE